MEFAIGYIAAILLIVGGFCWLIIHDISRIIKYNKIKKEKGKEAAQEFLKSRKKKKQK
ncbi:hypothetical protein [Lactovum odontotermitis]